MIKTTYPKIEKVINRVLIASIILFLPFTFFESIGFRLKGLYTFPTIGLIFIFSGVLYFALFKNSKKKIVTVLILTPLIGLGIVTLSIGREIIGFKIDDTTRMSVSTGGILACGENVVFTQSSHRIFDKEIFKIDNLCLKGIYKIETLKLDEKHVEFLIYHNGDLDSENPYRCNLNRFEVR